MKTIDSTTRSIAVPDTSINSGAVISPCGKYRYRLWRIWDSDSPIALWVMLNPSKADATENDHTIEKLIRFCDKWAFGGFYVGNLFPYRATKPTELKLAGDSVFGEDNISHIKDMADLCHLKILAHGNPPVKPQFDVKAMYDDWHYLKLTNSGNPYHPLYLKESLIPKMLQ